MSDDTPSGQVAGGTLEEYSVGPLTDETWLTIYEMLSHAWNDAPEHLKDEYWEARMDFLAAHPEEATGNPDEDWSDGMKEAWNETVAEMIEDA